MSRIGRLTVAALAAVLVIAGLAVYFFVPRFLGDRRPEAYVPLFAEIEPAEEAVIRGTEAWIRWNSSMPAKGRVLWRKAGDSEFQTVEAGDGVHHLARLRPLQPDGKYEYSVEQSADGMTQRSGLRTFTVQAGLVFDPSTVEQTVQRDYDQTVTLTLRNDAKEKITVAAKALAQFEDLPADIVGPGSVDEPAEVEPGQKLNLRFAIAATDAARPTYDIPIEAAGASALLRLRVGQPKLNLSFQVVGEYPQTLAKTIEVRNQGDTVADLAIRVAPPNEAELRLEPRANHARLEKGQTLRFIASPILYLEFQSLKAEFEAAAAGQSVRFPLEFNAPSGQRLIGVRTGSHKESSCQDWYCTNRPTTCSTCPGPAGNGPALSREQERPRESTSERSSGSKTASLRIVPASFKRGTQLFAQTAGGVSGTLESGKSGYPDPKQGPCPAGCPPNCWDSYKQLVKKWEAAVQHINKTMTYGEYWEKGGLKIPELNSVLHQFYTLRETCPECDLRPIYRFAQPNPLKTPEDRIALLEEKLREQSETIARLNDSERKREAEARRDEENQTYKDALKLCQSIPVADLFCNAGEFFQEKSDAHYKTIDPPSSEYKVPVQPVPRLLPKGLALTGSERLAWENLEALNLQLAYLEAWFASLERYQGARAAGDKQAATLQAERMIAFSEAAIHTAQVARIKLHEVERAVLPDLDTLVARKDFDEALRQRGQAVSAKSRSAEIRAAFLKAGWSEADVREALDRASSPEAIRRAVQRSALRVKRDMNIRSVLLARDPSAVWPEPPDLLILTERKRLSGQLLRAAGEFGGEVATAGNVGLRRVALRPGLVEALQRRATFSRAHRGPFAAPFDGRSDSSSMATGWHTGERVLFAWHQADHGILIAAFNRQGEVLMEPGVVGTGRWLRLAADGKRTALAWTRGNDSVIRLHDGDQWAPEIPLSGQEAALAFAPGGPLYAATSTGLWRLGDKGFEQLKEARYSQPAVAVDGQGRPHVALERDGRILYGDADVDEGQRPSLTVGPDGTAHLAYLSKGVLVVRSRRGDQWSPPETIPAKNPSWPTLATDGTGVRLTYLGAADHGPDALWLVRLPDKQPILMPSLAGNVTDAWLLVHFGLNTNRSNYRPHDVLVTVNDVWIKMFENTVPDGRYLFRLNPYHIFTSAGRPALNRIGIRSWHVNSGHYQSSSDYRLIVRTAWSERYAFAASEEEVRRVADNPHPTHNQPDLVVLANELELPVAAPKPGRINLTVTIGNLGEVESQPARLEMLSEQKSLASARVPPLKPGDLTTVKMPLDYDGRLEQVTFKVYQDKADLNPKNDTLTLKLWGAPPSVTASEPVSTKGTGEQPPSPKFDSGIKLEVASWVPQRDSSHGWWGVTRQGQPPDKRLHWTKTADTLLMPPGRYDLYWKQGYDPAPVLLASDIKVEAGQVRTFKADTGIRLEVASWVPKRDDHNGWWGVTRQGQLPDKRVHWTKTADALVLPPGSYDVYWKQGYDPAPVLLASDIKVEAGQVRIFKADTGIRLEVASWVPKRDDHNGWWGVTRQGQPPDKRVHWTKTADALVLPPGSYDVFWKQAYDPAPVLLTSAVKVETGQLQTVGANSGIKLRMPAGIPALDPSHGWWGVVRTGEGPDKRLHWSKGRFDQPLLVPPGKYDVFWKQNYAHKPERVKEHVTVQSNRLVEIDVVPPRQDLTR